MPVTRMMLGYGAIFLGAVAIFMGAAVMVNALATGTIRYSHGSGAETITSTAKLAEDPGAFWRRFTVLGGLPALGGLAGLFWGRRFLNR